MSTISDVMCATSCSNESCIYFHRDIRAKMYDRRCLMEVLHGGGDPKPLHRKSKVPDSRQRVKSSQLSMRPSDAISKFISRCYPSLHGNIFCNIQRTPLLSHRCTAVLQHDLSIVLLAQLPDPAATLDNYLSMYFRHCETLMCRSA